MLDFKLICVNILSRETCFLCLRGPSPLYGSTIVGFSRCPAAVYFKAALCSLNIVIRISELRVWVCVVLCRAEQVFRLRIGHNAVGSGWELAVDLDWHGTGLFLLDQEPTLDGGVAGVHGRPRS